MMLHNSESGRNGKCFLCSAVAVFLGLFPLVHALAATDRVTADDVDRAARKISGTVFADAQFAMMAMWDDGTVISALSEDRKMSPASNMKVLSTGAALLALGGDFRWTTELLCAGTIGEDGCLDGDLYIKGGGDPLLGSRVTGTQDIKEVFASWYSEIRAAGITSVNGSVVADGSWLEGMREEPGWLYYDLGTYYGTCLSGLNFYENRQDFIAVPGQADGQPVEVKPAYPHCPWMNFHYACTTGAKGAGDRLYYYSAQGSTDGVVRGSLAADVKQKRLMCRNNYPEYTLANEFCNYLSDKGFLVKNGPASLPVSPFVAAAVPPADKVRPLCRTLSLPLETVVRHTNKHSDNLCAELMLRTLGKVLKGSSDIENSREAVLSVLRDSLGLQIDSKSLVLMDGSGLSRENLISARFMCKYLCSMLSVPCADSFVESLVHLTDRVRVKTGSFSGCRCLCGYVLPAAAGEGNNANSAGKPGRTIVFSIMVNNSHLKMWPADRQERKLVSLLSDLSAS